MKRFFVLLCLGALLCCPKLFAELPREQKADIASYEVVFYIDYSSSMRKEIVATKEEVARGCYRLWASQLCTWKEKNTPELSDLSISYYTIFQRKKNRSFWRSDRKAKTLKAIDGTISPSKNKFWGWNYKWFGNPDGDATNFVDWIKYFNEYKPGRRTVAVLITDASYTERELLTLNKDLAARNSKLVICSLAGKLGSDDPSSIILESIDNTLNEVGDLLLADGKNITLQSETDKDGYAREVKIAIHGINPRHIKEISWYINGKKCTADGGSFRQYLREPGKHEIAAAVTFFNGTVVVRKAAFSVTKPVVKLSLLGKAADYAREVKFELDGFNRRYVKNISSVILTPSPAVIAEIASRMSVITSSLSAFSSGVRGSVKYSPSCPSTLCPFSYTNLLSVRINIR